MEASELTAESVVTASADEVSATLEGETILLDLESGVYYGLNETGSDAWKLLQEPIQVAELRDKLCEQYDVSEERCETDLLELLEQLRQEQLIQTVT